MRYRATGSASASRGAGSSEGGVADRYVTPRSPQHQRGPLLAAAACATCSAQRARRRRADGASPSAYLPGCPGSRVSLWFCTAFAARHSLRRPAQRAARRELVGTTSGAAAARRGIVVEASGRAGHACSPPPMPALPQPLAWRPLQRSCTPARRAVGSGQASELHCQQEPYCTASKISTCAQRPAASFGAKL